MGVSARPLNGALHSCAHFNPALRFLITPPTSVLLLLPALTLSVLCDLCSARPLSELQLAFTRI
jgi:hypothetical protein